MMLRHAAYSIYKTGTLLRQSALRVHRRLHRIFL